MSDQRHSGGYLVRTKLNTLPTIGMSDSGKKTNVQLYMGYGILILPPVTASIFQSVKWLGMKKTAEGQFVIGQAFFPFAIASHLNLVLM
jgi:hypothetical protein